MQVFVAVRFVKYSSLCICESLVVKVEQSKYNLIITLSEIQIHNLLKFQTRHYTDLRHSIL